MLAVPVVRFLILGRPSRRNIDLSEIPSAHKGLDYFAVARQTDQDYSPCIGALESVGKGRLAKITPPPALPEHVREAAPGDLSHARSRVPELVPGSRFRAVNEASLTKLNPFLIAG
jgi:hypothetical protein